MSVALNISKTCVKYLKSNKLNCTVGPLEFIVMLNASYGFLVLHLGLNFMDFNIPCAFI